MFPKTIIRYDYAPFDFNLNEKYEDIKEMWDNFTISKKIIYSSIIILPITVYVFLKINVY